MKILELLIENVEWIFSGIGVVVLSFIIQAVFKKRNVGETKEVRYSALPELFPGYRGSGNKRIISFYDFIPNFILKRIFPESHLASLITIDVRPRGESVHLNLGELPSCNAYLVIVNHSPFDIEFENIKAKLNYGGCSIALESQDFVKVKKHSTNNLVFLEGILTGEQAVHCSKQKSSSRNSLVVQVRLRCSLGVFAKNTGELEHINVSIINAREV